MFSFVLAIVSLPNYNCANYEDDMHCYHGSNLLIQVLEMKRCSKRVFILCEIHVLLHKMFWYDSASVKLKSQHLMDLFH